MQRHLLQQLGLPAIAMILILIVGGCAPEAEKPLEEVNYRLKWLYNISVVGDLYALDSGLFAKHGLAVNVKPGGPEKDAIKELELGHAQFGVASADQVIRAKHRRILKAKPSASPTAATMKPSCARCWPSMASGKMKSRYSVCVTTIPLFTRAKSTCGPFIAMPRRRLSALSCKTLVNALI